MSSPDGPGRTEDEIVGEGLRWLAASGGFTYDVAVSSGPSGIAIAIARPCDLDSQRRLAAGDMIHSTSGALCPRLLLRLDPLTVMGPPPSASDSAISRVSIALIKSVISEVEPGRQLSHLDAAGVADRARGVAGPRFRP